MRLPSVQLMLKLQTTGHGGQKIVPEPQLTEPTHPPEAQLRSEAWQDELPLQLMVVPLPQLTLAEQTAAAGEGFDAPRSRAQPTTTRKQHREICIFCLLGKLAGAYHLCAARSGL